MSEWERREGKRGAASRALCLHLNSTCHPEKGYNACTDAIYTRETRRLVACVYGRTHEEQQ